MSSKTHTIKDERSAPLAAWVRCYSHLIYRYPFAMTRGYQLTAEDRARFPILCRLIDEARGARSRQQLSA